MEIFESGVAPRVAFRPESCMSLDSVRISWRLTLPTESQSRTEVE